MKGYASNALVAEYSQKWIVAEENQIPTNNIIYRISCTVKPNNNIIYRISCTVNLLYTYNRYNDKIRYVDNFTGMKPTL